MTMSMTEDRLLVELLVEELPPKSLKVLGQSFATTLTASLQSQHLIGGNDSNPACVSFATPRRLAVVIEHVLSHAPDQTLEVKLMPVRIGLDEHGNPTPALQKKIQSLGISLPSDKPADTLLRRMDGKAETLFIRTESAGITLAAGLQKALDTAIRQLPVAKVMTYQLADGWSSIDFVRPAHSLIALYGAAIVPVSILGLDAGRETQGHRFEAHARPLRITHADSYAQQLESEGAVIAGFETRRHHIATQLVAVAGNAGLIPADDAVLLDEVTALVEYPVVLAGHFDAAFLEVPQECLILTMKSNQRYFPLLDAKGKLANQFLIISNIRPADPGLVISGNERVLRARLADARFFFNQDRKQTLASYLPGLDKVVYHNQLGTQAERVKRITEIAAELGQRLGGPDLADNARRAAALCKADLLTGMVGEFPELQGVMGRYYALHDNISEEIADAIEDHYKPRFAGDNLPRNLTGTCVALADKLETLAGMFGIGEIPTGDKDPFALRRHALGIIRMLVEQDLQISLDHLVTLACKTIPHNTSASNNIQPPLSFILERARGYLEDRGFAPRAIDAVLEPSGRTIPLGRLASIARAATGFLASEQGQYLAEANKRITNILRKSGFDVPSGVSAQDMAAKPDTTLFRQDEEHLFFDALLAAGAASHKQHEERQYDQALHSLLPLCEPARAFFDKVMVNTEDPVIRNNRIALLQHARACMNQIADLSLMAGSS